MAEPIKFEDRNDAANDYIQKHKINELFSNLTAHLVFNQTGMIIFEIHWLTFLTFSQIGQKI